MKKKCFNTSDENTPQNIEDTHRNMLERKINLSCNYQRNDSRHILLVLQEKKKSSD